MRRNLTDDRRPFRILAAIAILAAGIAFGGHGTLADETAARPAPVAGDGQLAAKEGEDPHAALMSDNLFPSASECAVCHTKIYKQWASSNHAYASISPMFHKFEQKINDLSQGTMGTFCVRCHQQVGTQMGEPRELPLWERSRVSREGITCITCHRVNQEFAKVNGERTVLPAIIHEPVYGSMKGSVFDEVIAKKDELRMATNESERGAKVHAEVKPFDQISKSEFCVSCHQVTVNLGIKLEVVWDQYRDSPAAKQGITCQECHMGKVPGKAEGYERAPVAVVAGKEINPDRIHHNHAFYGPGYPVAHPGIFPHNPAAERWSIQEWLLFDYRAKWGSAEFEDKVQELTDVFSDVAFSIESIEGGKIAEGVEELNEQMEDVRAVLAEREEPRIRNSLQALEGAFARLKADNADAVAAQEVMGAYRSLRKGLGIDFPEVWSDIGDREDAWEVIAENLESLEEKRELRLQVMENGSRVDGPFFRGSPEVGKSLSFHYTITNTDPGHNLPSGSLGAQPEIWFNVALIDPDGKTVWESGYVDSHGDFADNHSLDVAAGKIPFDKQLFNLQTKFLTTNVKGTDREMYLPINLDVDQRPFLRPSNVPTTVLNHPPFVRMEARSLPPLGSRDAKYKVPANLITKPGTYRLASRLRSRAEPIYFMRFVGATSEMEEAMNEWMVDFHPYTVEFEVK